MTNANPALAAQTLAELNSIVENLLLLLSEKEKEVILKRFSLQGNRKHTLEEIGQSFSVTRERIRQIEKSALNKMGRNVFNTSLQNLHSYVSGIVDENGGLMKEEILTEEIKKAAPSNAKVSESDIHLALVLHEGLDSVGNTIDFHPYVKDRGMPGFTLKNVSNKLINQLHKYGDVKSIEKLQRDLKSVLDEAKFDTTKTKSLVEIDKRLTLLDDDMVGLMEWRHVHPRTLRDKILFVMRNDKKPMHFTDVSAKIESQDFDGRSVNVQAVHNELIRHDQFVLIGRGIYALQEWGYEPGTVADVVENILREYSELDQDEIIAKVLERRQVKEITIVLALKNGKRFARVGRRRYKIKS